MSTGAAPARSSARRRPPPPRPADPQQPPWPRSTTGECPCPCDYATDAGCTCRDLAEAMTVSIVKSPVFATYPVTYVQQFSGRPYEVRGTALGAE